jgi:hypothetical protein
MFRSALVNQCVSQAPWPQSGKIIEHQVRGKYLCLSADLCRIAGPLLSHRTSILSGTVKQPLGQVEDAAESQVERMCKPFNEGQDLNAECDQFVDVVLTSIAQFNRKYYH